MRLDNRTCGVLLAVILLLVLVEPAIVITRDVTTTTIPGENGEWEVEISKYAGKRDIIYIWYTPKANKTGCKNIRLSQTSKWVAYNDKGEIVTTSRQEVFKDPKLNPYKHREDDEIKDGVDLVSIDHLKCEGDPYFNGDDKRLDGFSQGDATSEPPELTGMYDIVGGPFELMKDNIKKIVITFETVAICADTGELLGSIRWQCVNTKTEQGEITLISDKESKPSETFKKAFKKFVEKHKETKVEKGKKEVRWHCPDTSDKIRGPGGILGNPWGNVIPEKFREKWITPKKPEDPCGGTIFLRGVKGNLPIGSRYKMYTGDVGMVKSGEELELDESRIGGGQHFESPMEALEAGFSDSGHCALKFTWSGNQTKVVRGILFTSYRTISPEDVSPFIEEEDRFINDFVALDAQVVPTALMEHMLDVMTGYAGPLQSSDGPVTVTIIANIGTEKAAAYTGTLLPEHVASFIIESAVHERVNQETLEVFHYIGVNFGLLPGSENCPPTEFFLDLKTGEPNAVIIVGSGAADMDVASASMLADKIGALVLLDTEFDFSDWKAACDYNLILVGGPVANVIVKELVDEGISVVNWALSLGEWEYYEAPYGGCNILIIAGADRDATRGAAQSLIQWI